MSEAGNRTRGKIQAAKKWLNRAEDHFDRKSASRGELDLLLAEAELRSTRESLQARPGRLNLHWIQQGIAFGLATVLVAAGVGAAWWWQVDRAESIPTPTVTVASPVTTPVRSDQPLNISAVPAPKTENSPAAVVDSTIPGQEVKNIDKSANREPSVSQDEMKRLIRAAGQSLRGQTKQ